MKRKTVIGIGILCVLFLLAQVIRPEKTSVSTVTPGDITNHLNVPADVLSVMKKACYDCHSDNTVWPWYSHIAPVSWLLAMDVRVGRKHLNLSRWDELDTVKQLVALQLMNAQVETGGMPPFQYTLMHRDAILTDEEKNSFDVWARQRMEELKP